jgi:hypothetical protein
MTTDSNFQIYSSVKLACIPPENTLRSAGFAAGRLLVVVESLDTKITFYGNLSFIIKLHGPERAGLKTISATDTKRVVDQHDAAFIPDNGIHGA